MPTTDPQNQSWSIYQGEDVPFVLTADADDPSSWDMVATVSIQEGYLPPEASNTNVTGGGSAGSYTLSFSFTRAQTAEWPATQVYMDVWRTDSGFNQRLAGGSITVNVPVRDPED